VREDFGKNGKNLARNQNGRVLVRWKILETFHPLMCIKVEMMLEDDEDLFQIRPNLPGLRLQYFKLTMSRDPAQGIHRGDRKSLFLSSYSLLTEISQLTDSFACSFSSIDLSPFVKETSHCRCSERPQFVGSRHQPSCLHLLESSIEEL